MTCNPRIHWNYGNRRLSNLNNLGITFRERGFRYEGQVIASLTAVESIIKTGNLPVNIKFLFEGEEEVGSPNLDQFIEDHKLLLASDLVLNPDSGMIAPTSPTIIYALRGLAYFELRVFGPAHDLHSGVFGA